MCIEPRRVPVLRVESRQRRVATALRGRMTTLTFYQPPLLLHPQADQPDTFLWRLAGREWWPQPWRTSPRLTNKTRKMQRGDKLTFKGIYFLLSTRVSRWRTVTLAPQGGQAGSLLVLLTRPCREGVCSSGVSAIGCLRESPLQR